MLIASNSNLFLIWNKNVNYKWRHSLRQTDNRSTKLKPQQNWNPVKSKSRCFVKPDPWIQSMNPLTILTWDLTLGRFKTAWTKESIVSSSFHKQTKSCEAPQPLQPWAAAAAREINIKSRQSSSLWCIITHKNIWNAEQQISAKSQYDWILLYCAIVFSLTSSALHQILHTAEAPCWQACELYGAEGEESAQSSERHLFSP